MYGAARPGAGVHHKSMAPTGTNEAKLNAIVRPLPTGIIMPKIVCVAPVLVALEPDSTVITVILTEGE